MEKLPKGGSEGGEDIRPVQRFQFGPWVFNIDRALALVAEAPRETGVVNVLPTARFYGLDTIEGDEARSLFSPMRLDREYAMTTDIDTPVLVATALNEDGHDYHLLIDGIHRLYRAYTEGAEELPAYFLTLKESQAVREDPFAGSPLYWPSYDPVRYDELPPQSGSENE